VRGVLKAELEAGPKMEPEVESEAKSEVVSVKEPEAESGTEIGKLDSEE
jgi:hypothetical protein